MTVKTITITESAYESLRHIKTSNESFSDVITKLTRKKSLLDFFGTISKQQGESLEKTLLASRKKQGKLQEERTKNFWGK